jgi:hypothetical protein
MLEATGPIEVHEMVYRLANPPGLRAALAELEMEATEVLETINFLQGTAADDASVLLTSPFADKSDYKPISTRFSDGTWRVFYSALDPETCEKEVGHWCLRNMQSDPPVLRRFFYREFSCRLNARAYDLRPMRDKWPFLTGDVSTYPKCQDLAREARATNADAMLCPSARRKDGTTAPVFVLQVLSGVTILGVVGIEIDSNGAIRAIRN